MSHTPEEAHFLKELNIFLNEVRSAQRFLYAELSILQVAGNRKKTLDALNYNGIFWKTVLGALQHATFITLGRIFDGKYGKYKLETLIAHIEQNPHIFSKETFRQRWIRERGEDSLLPHYIETVYDPKPKDFKSLRRFVEGLKKEYENLYEMVRHQFGHKFLVEEKETNAHFNKVNIRRLEKFCVTLDGIYHSLWNAFHNGRGPFLPLPRRRYSTKNLIAKPLKKDDAQQVNAQFVRDAKSALKLLTDGYSRKLLRDRKQLAKLTRRR